MSDLSVAGILTLLIFNDFMFYILKWSTDDTIVLKHSIASWFLWWTQFCTAEILGFCQDRERGEGLQTNDGAEVYDRHLLWPLA